MKNMMLAAVLVLTATAALAQSDDRLAATLNGERITMAELDAAWDALSDDLREIYDRSGGKLVYLETYLRRKLIVQEAFKSNLQNEPSVAAELRRMRDEILFDRYVRDVLARSVISEAELSRTTRATPPSSPVRRRSRLATSSRPRATSRSSIPAATTR